MFFVKALAGCMVVVFGGFWALGAFDPDQEVVQAVESVPKAEIEQQKTVAWGPHCSKLRDELFGKSSGMPAVQGANDGIGAIVKLHKISGKLKAAGCDPDAAPGAFSPFEPNKSEFRKVTNTMGEAPSGYSKPDADAHTSGSNYGKPDPRASTPASTQDMAPGDGWGKAAQN